MHLLHHAVDLDVCMLISQADHRSDDSTSLVFMHLSHETAK